MKKLLMIICISTLLSSCSNFYKAITNGQPTTASLDDLKKQQKYFILRDNTIGYEMLNVNFSADGKNIECDLASLPDEHMTHMWKGEDERLKYEKSYAGYVLNEVHIYARGDSNMAPGHYILPLQNVLKTEVLQKDVVMTKKNHTRAVLLGVGGTAVLLVGVAAIIVSAGWDWGIH